MALNPGHTLLNGLYHILSLLGRGGFGFVYEAQDTLLNEKVAIKELIPALVGDEATLKRFLAEARATMRLTHRHIVRTHNVFSEGDNYYIVMEYMAGGSLEQRLRDRGPLPVADAVQMAAEVCEGLACAHEEQVVHCDLKPANILFDASGRAKVADFGIAHVSGEMLTRSWMTPAGFVAGTLPYMSPEQVDGVRDDPRLDLYALGAVLYRALTGRTYLEFDQQETPRAQAENVGRITSQQPSPPSHHDRSIPAWLDGVVLKALAKQVEDRYADADAMKSALVQQQPALAPVALPSALPPTKMVSAPPARRTPAGSGVKPVSAARKKTPLPVWFWPAAAGASVLLVVLVIAIGAALLPPTHTPTPTAAPQGTDTPPLTTTHNPHPTATLAPTATSTPNSPQGGATQTRSKDGMVMVYVAAGDFLMGSTNADSNAYNDEKPQHTVYLDAFWIDKTEVSNAQYQKCEAAGACTASRCTDNSKYNGAQQPVVCVDWNDAQAYCQWAGARLPTEAEWEKAARGSDGRIYSWGNEAPDCIKANYWGKDGGCVGSTSQVGSYPAGASPYGALDMTGNVWEWVADWYNHDYYTNSPERNPQGPSSGDYRVLRGGAFDLYEEDVRAANRILYLPPSELGIDVGFRCARSGSEPSLPTGTPTPTPTPIVTPKAGATKGRERDDAVMVYVPAGEFLMGSADADDKAAKFEKPQHAVYLDAFWIDKTEVTNTQFRKCVEAGACRAPTSSDWGAPTYGDVSHANHPVVCVSWYDAQAYCQWAGARLPTEAEWEKAARGTDERLYPWGNSAPDDSKANVDGWGTKPVESAPGDTSPYGAVDMAGNVSEWVADWYDADYYAKSPGDNPPGPATGESRVQRGGSWHTESYYDFSRAAARWWDRYPFFRVSFTGFRCAVSAGE